MTVEEIYKEIVKEARSKPTSTESLKFLFSLDKKIYQFLGNESVRYGGGLHTKHRHTKYHDFFIDNIHDGDQILDIGCGNGAVDIDIMRNREDIYILGIDLNEENIDFANNTCTEYGKNTLKKHELANICQFERGNIFDYEFEFGQFDVCIFSNVLEHLENRIFLLKKLKQIHPRCILIRVPMFERSWKVPLMEELRIDYRLDDTHFIEYTENEFKKEINNAGLKIDSFQAKWGEFYVVIS